MNWFLQTDNKHNFYGWGVLQDLFQGKGRHCYKLDSKILM